MRKIITTLAIVVITFAAGYVMSSYDNIFNKKKVIERESTVLLEQVKTVSKLVTVEGHFSEIYDEKQYVYFDLPFWRKDVLMTVKAKVLVGFDLEKMKFTTDNEKRQLIVSNMPEPEIISVEPEIKYSRMYQGYFNSYSKEELTAINKKAKNFIYQKAKESDFLMESAKRQGNEIFNLIELMARDAGWEVVYEDADAPVAIPAPVRDTTLKD